ncbi:MAG: hypothetical protein GYB67_17885 [Chloroflexi bacterium]|nr:hypothetical protein [Chloroflexota bacterium]
MTESFKRTGESTWEWQFGARGYSVRAFQRTRKLIWSSWVERPEGPMFDDGVAQTFEHFLEGHPPPHNPPAEVIDALRASLSPKPRRGLLGRRL